MKAYGSHIRGFTIVELLIVVVVIAVLSSVTVVSYNGIMRQASNTTRAAEVQGWLKSFAAYKAMYGTYPVVPLGGDGVEDFCLGENFPVGGGGERRCREYNLTTSMSYRQIDNQQLMTEIKKVSSIPTQSPSPVNGWIVGPYINYWETGFTITQIFSGNENNCPSFMQYTWHNGAGTVLCYVNVLN